MTAEAIPAAGWDAVAPLTPNAWLRYAVLRQLLPARSADVLEVGCGQGALGARLAAGHRYLGVEPDPESCAVAQRRIGEVGRGEVRNTTAESLGAQRFDVVCAFEVLEHIEDDAGAVTRWAGLLRPGGWLVLSVPAHQRRFGPADQLVGHFRRYDPDALVALLAGRGLTDIRVRQYGFPLGYLLEWARNRIAARRLSGAAGTVAERTAGSGRLLQPSGRLRGALNRWGTAPFRWLQNLFPATGTGLVVRAQLPVTDPPAAPARP